MNDIGLSINPKSGLDRISKAQFVDNNFEVIISYIFRYYSHYHIRGNIIKVKLGLALNFIIHLF
jgi:hypothetical protein